MSKLSHPSLVLVFWWGHLAPALSDTTTQETPPETDIFNLANLRSGGSGQSHAGSGLTDPRALIAELPTDLMTNYPQMVSLVAGNTRDYQHPLAKPNAILEQVLDMERQPRHYLMISAFDFHDWLHHKSTLLWQEHVSTEFWDQSLQQVLEPMIAAAAPFFGRETVAPHITGVPVSHVIVGEPEVKGFPDLPVPPPPSAN